MQQISLKEIEKVFALIIRMLKNEHDSVYQFDFDYYWIVLTDEWSDMNSNPKLGVGSLADDIGGLKQSLAEDENFDYDNLERLATVLRAICEQKFPKE